MSAPFSDARGERTDLRKGAGIQTILARHLETDVIAGFRVPCRFGACLNLGVDLVVVGGSKHAQVVRGSDGGGVFRLRVTNGSGVLRDSSFLRVVASFRTD